MFIISWELSNFPEVSSGGGGRKSFPVMIQPAYHSKLLAKITLAIKVALFSSTCLFPSGSPANLFPLPLSRDKLLTLSSEGLRPGKSSSGGWSPVGVAHKPFTYTPGNR